MKKIAIYSPYLNTLGGGERYILTIAEYLSDNNDVSIFWDNKEIVSRIKERLNINLSRVNFLPSFTGKNLVYKYSHLKNFDVLFFVSDGSIPIGFSKNNILHFQVPFKAKPKFVNAVKLRSWKKIIVNSIFTKKFIDQSYSVSSLVVYPPVDVNSFRYGEKENIILSVGRFFSPLHDKKQNILIDAFTRMKLGNWKLILAGGVDESAKGKIYEIQKKFSKFKIEIFPNINFQDLSTIYSKTKIYWHAAGFEENENENPEMVEHFGISTVEAMASGAVPIVVPKGGQKEIVRDGENGFYFQTTEELIDKTKNLINNGNLLEEVSKNALKDSVKYSKEAFCKKIDSII